MSPDDPPTRRGGFHAGEQAMQARSGTGMRSAEAGARLIRDHMPDPHRELFEQLPFAILGGLDAGRQPWATILAGPPGFLHTLDARTMRVATVPGPHDALAGSLRVGAAVGLLGLQPRSRRRNRMNGLVTAIDAAGFTVRVLESFGNCPKYIQARDVDYAPERRSAGAATCAPGFDADSRRIVAAADTLFIATAHPDAGIDPGIAWGADVSHRGGKPGFVRIASAGEGAQARLTLPDFVGNAFFNTFGNLVLNPRVGLLFIDFAGGGLLQIAGTATIDDGPARLAYAGAQRLLHVDVKAVRRVGGPLPLCWGEAVEPAPQLAATGAWP